MAHPYNAEGLRRGIGAFVQGRLAAGVLSIATALVIVRALPIEQYAVYATMSGLVVIVSEAATFGMPHVINRFIPIGWMHARPKDFIRFIWRLTALRLFCIVVIAAILGLLTTPIAAVLNASNLPQALLANWVFIVCYVGVSHVGHLLESLMDQPAVRMGLFAEWAPKLALTVAWIHLFDELTATEAILIHAGTALIGASLMTYRLVRRLRTLTRDAAHPNALAPWPEDHGAIARFSLQNYAHTLLLLPTESSGLRLIAASSLTTLQMAAFGFFHSLCSALKRYLPIHFLIVTIEPLLMARYFETRSFQRLNEHSNILIKLNLALVSPLSVWLAIVGPFVVGTLTGGKYVTLAWIFPFLLWEPVLEARWYMLRTASNALDRTRYLVESAVIGLAILAAMLVLLVYRTWEPLYIILGGMLVLPLARNSWVVLRLRNAGFPYRLDAIGMARIAVVAMLAGGVAVATLRSAAPADDLVTAAFATGVFGLAYMCGLVVVRPFSRRELEVIDQVIGDRLPSALRWRART